MRLRPAFALLVGVALTLAGTAVADEGNVPRTHVRLEPGGGAAADDPRLAPLSSRLPLRSTASGDPGQMDAMEAWLPIGPRRGRGRRLLLYRPGAGQPYAGLLVDADGDGSLTDEAPLAATVRKSGNSTWYLFEAVLRVTHGAKDDTTEEPYPLELFVLLSTPSARPDHVGYRGKGLRTGRVELGGLPYEITVSDRDNDAIYGFADAWTMRALHSGDSDERPEVRRIGEPLEAGGRLWRLELEGSAGRAAWVAPHEGPVPAMPEEDPRGAPLVDDGVPQATAPLAFEDGLEAGRAKAEQEQAPYLVYFEHAGEHGCAVMRDRVFGAASVVEAARGLVCIRIDAAIDPDTPEAHGVDVYPTGILFDPLGEELARFEGEQDAEAFEAFVAEANPHLPPSDREPTLKGKAKRRHKKVVKEHLAFLEDGKSHGLLVDRIAVLGTQKTRGSRDALVVFASNRKSKEYIAAAFFALGKIGGAKSIEFLCSKKALRSGDFLVAQKAAEALGIARDPRGTQALLDVMTHRRTKIEIVAACALAVAKSDPKNDRVVEAVFEYSRHKKDTIRAGAVEALGYLRSNEAVARLKDVLVNDKNTRVRGAAAWGIGHTERPGLIPVLRKAVAEDSSHTVRTAALEAIRELQGEDE